MAIPTTIAVPVVAAGLVYLNGRWRLNADWRILGNWTSAMRWFNKREKNGKANSFYLIEEHANNPQVADKLFIVYRGRTWSFKEAYISTLRYAGWLHAKHHVVKGEIVAVDLMNSPQFIFLTLALWSLGAVPAFINYNLTNDPFVHCVRTSTARLLIVDPEIEPTLLSLETKAILSSPAFTKDSGPLTVDVLTLGLQSSLEYFPSYRAPDSVRSGARARDTLGLIFTSGTTGLPKAAIVPWSRTAVASSFSFRWAGFRPVTSKNPDRYYTSMPLYHGTGFQLGFHLCLAHAVTLILSRKFSVSNFWDEVVENEVTAIQYVGEVLRYLLVQPARPDDDTRNKLRLAFGNGLRADVWNRFKERFGVETIAEFYGATEGGKAFFNFSRNDFGSGAIGSGGKISQLLDSLGSAFAEVDWHIESPLRDPKTGFCKKAARHKPGEMIVKLDPADIEARYQGYLNNTKATEGKLMRDVFAKGDVWYRTGDVLQSDPEGRVWFMDRIGDTYRWRSENVSTTEVGDVLGRHPQIHEANVYGVKLPGHEGRAGCAAVLLQGLDPGTGTIPVHLAESLARWVTSKLPKYAVPLFLRVTPEVHSTGNFKQLKQVLRTEGVDPGLVLSDKLYWLRPGSDRYEPFGHPQWQLLVAGLVKL